MGEIADAMIDGTLDYETGEYIGEPCGYPRTINTSNNVNVVRGVKNYLHNKVPKKEMYDFCVNAVKEIHQKDLKNQSWVIISETLQQSWSKFVNHVKKTKP